MQHEYRIYDKLEKQYVTDPENGTFAISMEGCLFNCKEHYGCILVDSTRYLIEWCTGLVDCKGVEIYQNDIIRSFYSDGTLCRHVIEWNSSEAKFVGRYLDYISHTLEDFTDIKQDWITKYDKEVISTNHAQTPTINEQK